MKPVDVRQVTLAIGCDVYTDVRLPIFSDVDLAQIMHRDASRVYDKDIMVARGIAARHMKDFNGRLTELWNEERAAIMDEIAQAFDRPSEKEPSPCPTLSQVRRIS